jgi:hypothetical protein
MKQRNASSFATLRISTVLAMLCALPVSPVSAIPIQLTSGGIFVESRIHFGGDIQTFVGLAGPGFSLTTDGGRLDQFSFAVGSPNHPLDFLPSGTITSFSGIMWIFSGGNPGIPGEPFSRATVIYGGESYFATGDFLVSTPTFVVGPLVTLPFSLSGFIHANNFMGAELDFEIFGAGTVTAGYSQLPTGLPDEFFWSTQGISYVIEPPPIPEPTSWMLLGSGLLGVAARRRSTRLNR